MQYLVWMYHVQCTVYSVYCTVYIMYSAHRVHCTLLEELSCNYVMLVSQLAMRSLAYVCVYTRACVYVRACVRACVHALLHPKVKLYAIHKR